MNTSPRNSWLTVETTWSLALIVIVISIRFVKIDTAQTQNDNNSEESASILAVFCDHIISQTKWAGNRIWCRSTYRNRYLCRYEFSTLLYQSCVEAYVGSETDSIRGFAPTMVSGGFGLSRRLYTRRGPAACAGAISTP